jgi:preprotein translocase SecE subunit
MSVAVKNAPSPAPASTSDRHVVVSLLGVLYVVGSLALLFKGLPFVLGYLGLWPAGLLGGTLMGAALVAGLAGLAVLGVRLLEPTQPRGVRIGLLVTLVLVLVAVGVARWASLWLEYWDFSQDAFGPNGRIIGAVGSALVALLVLGAGMWAVNHKWTQKQLLGVEDGGWLSATHYKSLQGVKVRRATLGALLLVALTGVYSLAVGGSLGRNAPDWSLLVPFTGVNAIDTLGDVKPALEQLDAQQKSTLEVRYPASTGYKTGQEISASAYRSLVKSIIEQPKFPADAKQAISAALDGEILQLLLKVNEQAIQHIRSFVDSAPPGFFKAEVKKALQDQLNKAEADPANVVALLNETSKQLATASEKDSAKLDQIRALLALPTAVLDVNRYTLRDINRKADERVRVGLIQPDFTKGATGDLKEGEIVLKTELDSKVNARVDELMKPFEKWQDDKPDDWRKKRQGFLDSAPERQTLYAAWGPMHYATLAQLPAVAYTVPILILAAAAWLSWRIVNMPAFADFLIATEAELNKVSWTTQRRLMQDTVVVLVTVVLMAVYLFGVDQLWRVALSSEYIRVLYIPKDQSDRNRSLEQKNW